MSKQTTVQIATIQEAVQIANEIERYEAALKQMKDALKDFVESVGLPVDTGEKVWDFSTSTSWDFSADKLKDLASEIFLMGHDPWEYLELNSRAISKLNLSPEMLRRFGKEKTTKRFVSRKSEAKKSA